MGSVAGVRQPKHTPTWLFGGGHGIQVWTVDVDASLRASVLISDEPPVILLNASIADTPLEGDALQWAFARVATGKHGLFVWRV
jgi:hypothetical protein